MRKPFNGDYPITSDFGIQRSFILNGKPYTDIHNGIDFGIPFGTPIVAPESGRAVMMWDSGGGGNMVIIYGPTGTHFLLHLSRYEGGSRQVNEGDSVGYVGASGNVTGTHFHWGMKVKNTWVNASNYLNNQTINNSYNQNNMDEFIIAKSKDGLSRIAGRAGLPNPDTQATWKYVASLNGSNDWNSFNAKIKEGQAIRVRPAQTSQPLIVQPSINVDTIKNELNAKFEAEKLELVKRYQNEINEVNTRASAEIEGLKKDLIDLNDKLADGELKSKAEIVYKEYRIKELESEIALRNIIVKNIEGNLLNNFVKYVESSTDIKEIEIIEGAKTNLLSAFFKGISKFFDIFPKIIRPVIYLGVGFLLAYLGTLLAGVNWTAFAENYPQYTVIASVMTAGLGNLIIYLLSTLGGQLREEAKVRQLELMSNN